MHLKAGRAEKGSHLGATELTAEGGWVSYFNCIQLLALQ